MKGPPPARRSRRRLTIRYGTGAAKHIGYSGNISRTGMMIRTTRVYAPGTRIHLEVEIAPRPLAMTGLVVWARTGEVRWLPTGRIGMGIKFVAPSDELINLLLPIAPAE